MNATGTIVLILGGGRGTRLYPLTKLRAKPAVPFGGRYRLIDIPISNCIHSGLTKIFVLTQYNSASLNRHLSRTYRFDVFNQGFVEVLAAEQTPESVNWFQGTADAVRQIRLHVEDRPARHILILAGDHLYRMDYRRFIADHARFQADATVAVTAVGEESASEFGLVRVDPEGRIVEFREKPKGAALEEIRCDTAASGLTEAEARRRPYLASMGIYVFTPRVLWDALARFPEYQDFGKEILPALVKSHRICTHFFDGYWQDIGTISTFFEANLQLVRKDAPFVLHDGTALIYSHARYLPGSILRDCEVKDSLISEGSILEGSHISGSVIGIRTRSERGVRIEDSLVMGADFYEGEVQAWRRKARVRIPMGIGEGTHIRRAIIDKNARVGKNCRLLNEAGVREADGSCYYIRDGIIIVPKNAIVRPGTVV
ncbi:MAG: glucose-1-phosphate adenylyltransferase [Planctomycetota bacterium]